MRGITPLAAVITALLLVPAYADEGKAKEWCTPAHMQKMDEMAAKMTDAAKQKEAQSELAMSRAGMDSKDMAACVAHMEKAHTAMGL